MRAKYCPDSWRYRASIRLPMMITGFYDPDHYYMYKASQAQAYADCVEFYETGAPAQRWICGSIIGCATS